MIVDPLIQLVATGLVAIVLARALLEKTGGYALYVATLREYRVVPAPVVPIAAAALLATEFATLALLLLPTTRTLGALAASGLLALYALAMTLALRAGRTQIECGCGGDGQQVSWMLVARNLALIALGVLPLAPAAARALGWTDFVEAVCAIIIGWLALATAEKTIENAAAARRLRSESYL